MSNRPRFVTMATVVASAALFSLSALAQTATQEKKTLTTGPGPDTVAISDVFGTSRAAAIIHPQPNAPAPALSKIFVNNVCTDSAGTNCETISSNQGATTNTYHSDAVYVYVWEIGYGNGEIATQGGAQLASSDLVGEVPVCVSGGYYTTSCPSGSTIYGWRYEWHNGRLLNLGYGNHFAAQDTSINSPYNTVNTFINVLYSK